MSVPPVSNDVARSTRDTLIALLGVAALVAISMMFAFSWLDSRTAPTIVFLATPDASIAAEVRGAVSTPGVVYLAPGSRMIDAVDATGGLSPDADRSLINLSTRIHDGQVIVVPTRPSSSEETGSGLININSASIDQLKELPGIGDVLAQRIVTYREINGPYQTVEDLVNVEGISESLVESLRPLITVTDND